MKALEEKILNEGTVLDSDILKVGSFLNQQIDIDFLLSMGEEIDRIYEGEEITKILTIEASGIAVAVAAAAFIRKKVIFAKKSKTSNVSGEVYGAKVHSFTHGIDSFITVPKDYLIVSKGVREYELAVLGHLKRPPLDERLFLCERYGLWFSRP